MNEKIYSQEQILELIADALRGYPDVQMLADLATVVTGRNIGCAVEAGRCLFIEFDEDEFDED